MKSIKKIYVLIAIGFISTSTYSQTGNIESLKKENSHLRKELTITKNEKDSFQSVSYTHLTLPTNREV